MTDDFWRGRRVLVTGVNGFLGAWLARTRWLRQCRATESSVTGGGAS